VTRLALLASLAWAASLTAPVFEAFGQAFSWRDAILIAGGLFLVYSATRETHRHMKATSRPRTAPQIGQFSPPLSSKSPCSTWCSRSTALSQAVGMASHLWIMAAAVVLA